MNPETDLEVDDLAPVVTDVTPYDMAHIITYMRLLDAEAEGADWTEVARIVLHRDPVEEGERTRTCWESHLSRARWMTKVGYRKVLQYSPADTTQ